MNFGQIREILDKYTIDCIDCPYKDREEQPDEDGIVPYESCNLDCETYYPKKIKEEILSLLDETKIEITPLNTTPKLKYKGTWTKLGMPENPEDGDCWSFETMACGSNVLYEERYYYQGQWNKLDTIEGLRLKYDY